METQVVITGIGLLGDYGIGKDSFMRFLSGFSSTTTLQEIDFDAYIDTSLVRRADYISRCALLAATLSLKDAGFVVSKEKAHKIGAILGTVHGALHYSLEYHSSLVLDNPKLVSPLLFSDSVVNAAVSHISTVLGIRGYTTTINGYCAVIQALQLGVDLIQQGLLDICLIGGADINNDFLKKGNHPKKFNCSYVDNCEIFEFLNEVNHRGEGNWIEAFNNSVQLKEHLTGWLTGEKTDVFNATYFNIYHNES